MTEHNPLPGSQGFQPEETLGEGIEAGESRSTQDSEAINWDERSNPLEKGIVPSPPHYSPFANLLIADDNTPLIGSSADPESPGLIIAQLGETRVSPFPTGRPLHDEPSYTVCKHCKKPVIKTDAVTHIMSCLKAESGEDKERDVLGAVKLAAAAVAAAWRKEVDQGAIGAHVEERTAAEEIKRDGAKKIAMEEDGPKRAAQMAHGGFSVSVPLLLRNPYTSCDRSQATGVLRAREEGGGACKGESKTKR
jgi:hypothetical protein